MNITTAEAVTAACPRRQSNVRARALKGEVVILDRRHGLVHHLNATATFIWDRCDGQHSVAAIARELAQSFDVEPEAAAHDVGHAVRQLEAADLLENPRHEGDTRA
jgi:hypothetical protein